jgi:hypothetical protein
MRNNIFILLVGIIFGAFIMLQFKGCDSKSASGKQRITKKSSTTTKVKTSVRIDYREGPTKIVKIKVPIDTTFKPTLFTHDIKDSNFEGTIYTTYEGRLLDQSLKYKVRETIINKTDSIIINTVDSILIETFVEDKRFLAYISSGITYSENNGASADFGLAIKFKNDYQIYYDYGLSLNQDIMPNTNRIGVKIPIKFKK